MTSDFETIFAALEDAGVRYLVVGGVAVVLHGVPRFTADLDITLDLTPDNVRAAIRALGELGYRPRVPVPIDDFADPARRDEWRHDRGMVVFSLWSDRFPLTEIDLFVEAPFDFDEAFERSAQAALGDTSPRFASIADLIAMKELVGRPRDLEDIRALRLLNGRPAGE